MKFVAKIIKKIVFGIFSIYSIDILFSAVGVNIPINIFTILTSSFLGVFGLGALIIIKFMI